MSAKSIAVVLLGAAALLLIPFVAMQFSNEVNWDLADFIVTWLILSVAGLSYLFATRKITNTNYRFIIGAVIAVILFYILAELAVGIFFNWGS